MAAILIIEHEAKSGPALIDERLRAAGHDVDVVGPERRAGFPPNIDGYGGLVVLGGEPGPNDDDSAPWLPQTRRLIKRALEKRVPVLGVCLGAQLLAVSAGGEVSLSRGGPEVGLHELNIEPEARSDALLAGLASAVPVVQWHTMEVSTLPKEAVLLGSNAHSKNQAFRIGQAAWGLQFHVEALYATVDRWVREDDGELNALGLLPGEVLDAVRVRESELRFTWSAVLDRWAQLVHRSEVLGVRQSGGNRVR